MGVDIKIVTDSVLTLLFMVVVGYAIRRLNIIDDKISKNLSTLVIVVGQPFMLIGALLKNEYSPELLKTGLFVTFLGLVVHTLLAVVSHFAAKLWRDAEESRILEFSLIFANCAFIGFPILEAAFGAKGLFYGSFYVISFNLFMWSYGMFVLGRVRREIKMSPLKMIVNYGTTPCLIGLALYVWQLKLPAFLLTGASYIGAICTPLSTFVIGSLLAAIPVKKIFGSGKVYLFCFLKLIVLPLIVAAAAKIVGLSNEFVVLSAIMSALPTAANTAMFAEIYDIKPKLAAHAVGMSSLLAPAAIPLILFVTDLILAKF